MKLESTFSCGDKGWVYTGADVRQLTIGQIQLVVTDSPGIYDCDDGGDEIQFDNYKCQHSTLEKYMCVETGIGSGTVYTLGEHIFKTEAECRAANAVRIAEQQRAKEVARQHQIESARRRREVAEEDLRKLGVSA